MLLLSLRPDASGWRNWPCAAALQKQVTRDFGPIWEIDADVSAFGRLSHVPLEYWPIVIRDDIHMDAQGIHLNEETASLLPWCRSRTTGR